MKQAARRNRFGQIIGVAVPDWSSRPVPPQIPLVGLHCRLEPLVPQHADALHAAYAEAPDDRDWTYLPDAWEPDRPAFRHRITVRAASGDPLHWAVTVAGEPLGSLALMRIDPGNGVMEIGHVHFAPRLQRTPAATEAVVLLARCAFVALGYRRLEWKCDSLNAPSRHAALRLGFAFEGLFRDAVIVKGRSRDTAWYAMTVEDFSAVEAAWSGWLAPTNFDDRGRQVASLGDVRAAGA